jgi:hypothetical protein
VLRVWGGLFANSAFLSTCTPYGVQRLEVLFRQPCDLRSTVDAVEPLALVDWPWMQNRRLHLRPSTKPPARSEIGTPYQVGPPRSLSDAVRGAKYCKAGLRH